jgi:hypothetical protein
MVKESELVEGLRERAKIIVGRLGSRCYHEHFCCF